MAKNYTELEMENNKTAGTANSIVTDNDQTIKHRLIRLIMEKIDNGSNIDYIVKLSEIYRNIK